MSDSKHTPDRTLSEADLLVAGFRQSEMPLVLLTKPGQVMRASRGTGVLLGCDEADIVGGDFALRFSEPEAFRAALDQPQDSFAGRVQLQARLADGGLLPVEIRCSHFAAEPAADTADSYCLVWLHDVGLRRREDELRAARLAKLTLLNQVSEALYGAQLNIDQILQAILVCMTAGQGLRFNRAFLLLVDPATNSLQGRMAIGPSNADEAARIWQDLSDQSTDLFEMVTFYDRSISQTDVAVNEIVRHMSIPMDDEANILIRIMGQGHVRRIAGDDDQPGVETLGHWLGCHEFAIAPMSTRGGPVGVIVADNAISGATITDLDLEFLQMFANQCAGAIENSRLYSELEQRLRDLHAAHEKQREDQETLLKMERLSVMGETSAIVAHELRNPLVAIGGFARSLTRSIEAGDPNLVSATIIVEEVGRRERIIRDLLDFIRPPKMLRTAMVADEIITQAVQKYEARALESEVDLVLDLQAADLQVAVNPGEIQQVLQNFLVNAMQALDGPGRVKIYSRGVDGGVEVTVSDSGPGFAPEVAELLQTPFFSTKPTRSGLGLTICAQIIKAHGGVLKALNRAEGGAEFSFILPRHKPDEGSEK